MVEMVFIGGAVCLLIAITAALIALKVQKHSLDTTRAQQHAWARAQEVRLQQWQEQQEKRAGKLQKRLTTQVEEWQSSWENREQKNNQHMEDTTQKQAIVPHVEHELSRLRLVEEIPWSRQGKYQRQPLEANWQPARLERADLSQRDLTHRYLGRANLREAKLVNTNLFMADLSGACLVKADLSGADLSATNLTHADLRDAILVGCNLLVADLDNANLLGANLLSTRNFTPAQLYTTTYDSTTQLDIEVDITKPRIPILNQPSATPEPPSPADGEMLSSSLPHENTSSSLSFQPSMDDENRLDSH